MSAPHLRPITIIGGGLAGLTLGLGLRQRDIPVTVWEAGGYPRHRVCGEFISGRGLGWLERAGLKTALMDEGAASARTVAFFSSDGKVRKQNLPGESLCLSRYKLDALLAEKFRALGGELKEHSRWKESMTGEGNVRATGRRVQAPGKGWRWFGLKIHAQRVDLCADLEIHLTKAGYVGLCRLAKGEINICGLFRTETPVPDLQRNWMAWFNGSPSLCRALAKAEFDLESFSSIAGLSLQATRAQASPECCLGDSLTMIPPVTGNGMSMAFESADLATIPLAEFSRGAISWEESCRKIALDCDAAFATRLRWATWLQRGLFNPLWNRLLFQSLQVAPGLWKILFLKTR